MTPEAIAELPSDLHQLSIKFDLGHPDAAAMLYGPDSLAWIYDFSSLTALDLTHYPFPELPEGTYTDLILVDWAFIEHWARPREIDRIDAHPDVRQ